MSLLIPAISISARPEHKHIEYDQLRPSPCRRPRVDTKPCSVSPGQCQTRMLFRRIANAAQTCKQHHIKQQLLKEDAPVGHAAARRQSFRSTARAHCHGRPQGGSKEERDRKQKQLVTDTAEGRSALLVTFCTAPSVAALNTKKRSNLVAARCADA